MVDTVRQILIVHIIKYKPLNELHSLIAILFKMVLTGWAAICDCVENGMMIDSVSHLLESILSKDSIDWHWVSAPCKRIKGALSCWQIFNIKTFKLIAIFNQWNGILCYFQSHREKNKIEINFCFSIWNITFQKFISKIWNDIMNSFHQIWIINTFFLPFQIFISKKQCVYCLLPTSQLLELEYGVCWWYRDENK